MHLSAAEKLLAPLLEIVGLSREDATGRAVSAETGVESSSKEVVLSVPAVVRRVFLQGPKAVDEWLLKIRALIRNIEDQIEAEVLSSSIADSSASLSSQLLCRSALCTKKDEVRNCDVPLFRR